MKWETEEVTYKHKHPYGNILRERRINRARSFSSKNTRFPTSAEQKLKTLLEINHFDFVFQKEIHADRFFRIADFYFPRGRMTPLIVEIDGGYHQTPEQIRLDGDRSKFLIKHTGCTIIRFTNEQVFNSFDDIITKIKSYHVFVRYQT